MSLITGQTARRPNKYPWATKLQKALQHNLWTEDEFTFQSDKQNFLVDMNDEQREIIKKILALIGQVEAKLKTFWPTIGSWYKHDSIASLGYLCGYTEVVHADAYTKLLEVAELIEVFEEVSEVKIVKKRLEYLTKHLEVKFENEQQQRIYAIILFTLFVENVSLFSQFYVINFFDKAYNQLKDTTNQVSYTIHEETLHAEFGINLINTLRQENPELFDDNLMKVVEKEVQDAYKHECKIIEWILGDFDDEYKDSGGKVVLNSEVMKFFIAERLNASMEEIGMPFKIKSKVDYSNETKWFNERHKLVKKTDTFAKVNTGYRKNADDYDNEEL